MRALVFGVALLAITSSPAGAQLLDVTPTVFQEIRALAEAARKEAPTSPRDASSAFVESFEKKFGNTMEAIFVVRQPALLITVTTPLNMARFAMLDALEQLTELPTNPPPAEVRFLVSPRQVGAPDVKRMVLFRDSVEVPAASNELKPREMKTAIRSVTIGAGPITFPIGAFTPGSVMKAVFITDGPPIEWEYSADRLGPKLK
jgi:hypothetical protein